MQKKNKKKAKVKKNISDNRIVGWKNPGTANIKPCLPVTQTLD